MANFALITLSITFLFFGSLQTVSQTFQLARKAAGSDRVERYFDHSYLLVLVMEAGQALCLMVYLFQQLVLGRIVKTRAVAPASEEDREIPVNIFIMFPSAVLDIVGVVLNNIGLVLSRDAGTFQMLSSTCMIWCGLLSVPAFRRNMAWFQWCGMAVILLGLFVKARVMIPGIFPEFEEKKDCDVYTATYSTATPVDHHDHHITIIGYASIVLGQLAYAGIYMYEEDIVNKYRIPPLKMVGYRGLFGCFAMGLLLWPLYFVKIGQAGDNSLFGTGPDHRLEDAIDGFTQIFGGSSNWLLAMILLFLVSCGINNSARLAISKEVGATGAVVLDNGRILLGW